MQRFMNWYRNFMWGRYGSDQLNIALLVLYLLFSIILRATGWWVLSWVILLLPIWMLFRMYSRNIQRRAAENRVFLRIWRPFNGWIGRVKDRAKGSAAYKYYKCPTCGQQLRVPRGRGKIRINCPKCHNSFEKKT